MNGRKVHLLPYGIGGFYFLVSNALFSQVLHQGSALLYAVLVWSTFPYGPFCLDLFNHLDRAVFVDFGVDQRNDLRHIVIYLLFVIGGSLWYGLLAKFGCWFLGRWVNRRN